MALPNKNKFSKAVWRRLIDDDLTVTELSRRVGHPRETVSRAINGSGTKFPRVRAKVAAALSITL